MNDIVIYLRRLLSLKTLDAFPLFVLSVVLFEDNQNSKHGGFDKCHICMGISNGLDSISELLCIILRFMHVFLQICLVSACLYFLL